MDGHFTDGTDLRDSNFLDQNGVAFHPGQRNDPVGAWHYVEVDLSTAAGKVLDFLLVGFDNGNDGYIGQYRAYIDDFSIGFPDGSSGGGGGGGGTPPPPTPTPTPAPGGSGWTSGGGGGGGGCGLTGAETMAFLIGIWFARGRRKR